jgi:hypothetical protein
MASPYQQQAFQRKLIYLGAIVVLFTAAWVWRTYAVEKQAQALGVLESTRGDVELSGRFLQLSLTGMKGFLISALWMTAMDEQRKNEWNELDLTVSTLTKLQPHYITPWEFQAWNLSYNVSVSLDRVNDKYYYIARGQQLLAAGERQNRDNPKLRWDLGFTYQHKITMHDETNVLRSLLQLSAIPPNERDPARFLIVEGGKTTINWPEFEDFCKKHPQLVRRLHSGIQRSTRREQFYFQFRCTTARTVVQFLADNYKVLSLYETPPPSATNLWTEKKQVPNPDEFERFPILPPPPGKANRTGNGPDTAAINSGTPLTDDHDAYTYARAWFAYSMEPLPPPGDMPGENKPVEDRLRQRVPTTMMSSIFRQSGPRAASYQAERLAQEGWFDRGPWAIPDWFANFDEPERKNKFSDGTPAQVEALEDNPLQKAWESAFRQWENLGHDTHLIVSEADKNYYTELGETYRNHEGLAKGTFPPNRRPEDFPENIRDSMWKSYRAYRFMRLYDINRNVTNFHHHYVQASVEQNTDTIEARKMFYLADGKRISALPNEALKLYNDPRAIPKWRAILTKKDNEEFRKDSFIQEETAEVELKYLDLVNEDLKPRMERATKVPWGMPLPLSVTAKEFPGRVFVESPFLDADGQPLVPPTVRQMVEQRRVRPGKQAPQQPQQQQPPGTPPGQVPTPMPMGM